MSRAENTGERPVDPTEAQIEAVAADERDGPVVMLNLNRYRDRDAYEERFRRMIAAAQLPPDVDQTLVRLNLLGALNWTHNWYRSGRKSPKELAHHLVQRILRRSLDSRPRRAEPRKVDLN